LSEWITTLLPSLHRQSGGSVDHRLDRPVRHDHHAAAALHVHIEIEADGHLGGSASDGLAGKDGGEVEAHVGQVLCSDSLKIEKVPTLIASIPNRFRATVGWQVEK
jgi:hypothetical protein